MGRIQRVAAMVRLLAGCLGLALLLQASSAAAFCRTSACNPTRQACATDANGCITSSPFLFWDDACASFGIQEAASPKRGVDYETARNVIIGAYRRWISVDCGGAYPSIIAGDRGAISCAAVEYNRDAPNANVWMFRDADWPYESDQFSDDGTLALTTVNYNPESGQIYDVDVEINSFENELSAGAESDKADLASIVTHEVGHFFGLSHSEYRDSTMYGKYLPGTSMRTLEADDAAGMCAIYPPGREASDSNCWPRNGFSRECSSEEAQSCTVSAASGFNTGLEPAWPFFMGMTFVWRRRRRSRNRGVTNSGAR